MKTMRRPWSVTSLVLLTMAGWACSEPATELPIFDLPAEIAPEWINPVDMESLFPDAPGCFVAVGDGVRVLQVFEGTRAHGVLRAGDIITSVDGAPTSSRETLLSILDGRKPGDLLRVVGTRAAAPFSTGVELSSVPEEPGRGIIGILPETRLRVLQPEEVPAGGEVDPSARPVVLDAGIYSHSPLAATWVPYPGAAEGVRAVALGSELYAVAAGETPALVRMGDGALIPIDPGPVVFESSVGPIDVFVSGLETALTSVGDLLLVAGTATEGDYSTSAVHAVDPVGGSVVWTRPLGLAPSGLPLVASNGYRSPSGDRALVSLVEQDVGTGAGSEVLTYYVLDVRGDGVMGPPGIDRFMPTSGVTGWHDENSLLYVAEVSGAGAAVWDLTTGEHSLLWPVPVEEVSDLFTVTPVGDGRHLVQVRANEVSLIDVHQPVPVRPIARGCSYTPIGGATGALLPSAIAI